MTDPTPQRDRPVGSDRPAETDRPVMGDHIDLEEVDERALRDRTAEPDAMSRFMLPGLAVLVIVLLVIAWFLWFS